MSIWKNKNESAYTGGKKHWADVIKNSGEGNLLIWRQPEEDFNTNSTLIVMHGEEAIFIKGGVIEQTFDNGTYKLSTENYPFISRLRNAFTGGASTFNCVVYFVRKAHSREILWGTDSPIQVRDNVLGMTTKLKARGAYKVKVVNPQIVLEKLMGNNVPYLAEEELPNYLRNEFQSKIKTSIAKATMEAKIELLGIDARLDEFSDLISPFLHEIIKDYGLELVKFSVAAVDVDDDALRRKFDEINIAAYEETKMRTAERTGDATGQKVAIDILGDDWIRATSAEILGDLANNTGAGGVAAAGAGLGMGIGAGGVFGNMAQQMFSPMNSQQTQQTPPQPTGRFTQKSAAEMPNQQTEISKEDPMQTLAKLKQMLDAGLIPQEKYDTKVDEVMKRM
ncbi:MAG: SPFH domain-containing protein [Lentimicrobiaceae bacterium]|jgi:membrane protease subunit (stomatin/prohibitin family)|nr:SPFH domain-containing protein [Lentimicrobiaceae bacterium]